MTPRNFWRWWAAMPLAGAIVLTSCNKPKASPPMPPPSHDPTPTPRYYLDHAQPKLRTLKLWVGAAELDTEIALTLTEISTGMMFRTNMLENEGMLFVFARPHKAAFYMRNTTVPLTAAYIDREGTILEIHDFVPLKEEPVEAGTDQVHYVLEVRRGWFARHNVGVGTVLTTERGSLAQVFQGRR